MLVDARTVPDGSLIEADVCIVGAGAAGITLARELRERPLRVVVLESGGLEPDRATRSLSEGAVTGHPYFRLDAARSRCFGGTTEQWSGECRPLDEQDFELRDWIRDSGWPFDLDHLLPFYERARSVCEIGSFPFDPPDWAEHGVRTLDLREGGIRTAAFHYSPPTRFGEVYREELRRAANVVVYLGASLVDLETYSPPVRVEAVRAACLSGTGFRVAARAFVLAAGGIENARLLLMANRVQAAGLGNGHDLVGRFFMEHLYLDTAARLRARDGSIGEFYTDGHEVAGRRVRGILGLDPGLRRREGLTNFCAVFDSPSTGLVVHGARSLASALIRGRLPVDTLPRLRYAAAHLGVEAARRRRIRAGKPPIRLYRAKYLLEQAPNPESRIVLGRARDRLRCPRVELRWRLSSIDERTARRGHEILSQELERAGIGRLRGALDRDGEPWPIRPRGGRHHMGTTRMHPDPRRGVVDADGRVHGLANLYVAGSSVFPTSGAANPTLTIVALALRLAGHLAAVGRGTGRAVSSPSTSA
ncbi:MAG: FAD-dependent oxidoreductase [Gemmatimonadota bacterium]